ncbi:ABC transporter ATP-binding protein [Planctomycetaceae bacterium SH139]
MSVKSADLGSQQRPERLVGYLLPSLLAQWKRLVFACFCLAASIVLKIVEPWPLQYVVDHILFPIAELDPGGDSSQLSTAAGSAESPRWNESTWLATSLCALSLIAVSGLRAAAEYWKSIIFSLSGNHVVSDLRARVYEHLQVLPVSFHGKSRNGDLTLRLVSDMNMLKEVAVNAALPLLSSALVLVGMFGYMLYLNWQLGFMVIGVIPVCGLITFRSTRKIHSASRRQRQHESQLASTAAESMAAVRTVQALGVGGRFSRDFTSQNQNSLRDGVKTGRLTAGLERSVDVMIAIASALVLWQGTRFVLEGTLTAGGLIVYLAYLKRGFRPLQGFAKYVARISKAAAAGDRITEILNTPVGIVDRAEAKPAPKLKGHLDLVNVTYGYDPEAPILQNLSLQIAAGERVAIVGPSGIGKSTLLSLFMRLDDPQRGSIRIDGVDIRDWQVQSLREQIAIVLQENVLFCGTIEDNLRLCNATASDQELLQALELATCSEFLEHARQGLSTFVGEQGSNLSKGQQQRIVLAQAVLRQTPILLLDEPTSSLDPKSRRAVREAIIQVSRHRTTLIVTHDMNLAQVCDKVLLLDGCQSVIFGAPEEVLKHDNAGGELFRETVKRGGSSDVNHVRC